MPIAGRDDVLYRHLVECLSLIRLYKAASYHSYYIFCSLVRHAMGASRRIAQFVHARTPVALILMSQASSPARGTQ